MIMTTVVTPAITPLIVILTKVMTIQIFQKIFNRSIGENKHNYKIKMKEIVKIIENEQF